MKARNLFVAALAAMLLAGPVAVAQEAPAKLDLKSFLAERVESVVSVKYVLRLQLSFMGQSQDREINSEARGVLLNDRGLVLTSNSQFTPPIRNPQIDIKSTPSDIRVLFANEEEEYEARIVARDSNLDLAFLQMLDPKDHPLKPVDLAAPGTIDVGSELLGVTRMPRSFDNAPMVGRLFVSAKVEKPRSMWAVQGDFGEVGLPVFDAAGLPVGILSLQHGSEGVDEGGLMGMGGGATPFVIPLDVVARSAKMAEERAAEMLATLAEEKAAAAEEGGVTPETPEDQPTEEPKDEPKDEPSGDQPSKDE